MLLHPIRKKRYAFRPKLKRKNTPVDNRFFIFIPSLFILTSFTRTGAAYLQASPPSLSLYPRELSHEQLSPLSQPVAGTGYRLQSNGLQQAFGF